MDVPNDRQPVAPTTRRLGALLGGAMLVIGCSGAGGGASPSAAAGGTAAGGASAAGATVNATLSEFKIDLSPASTGAGKVTFAIRNTGTTVHEFVVFRTDLAADKLPMASSEPEVDEEGEGIEAVDEVEDIAPGGSQSLTVDLTAGHYVAICNVAGHYQSGMHTEVTVGG